jgi:hypothetical protein
MLIVVSPSDQLPGAVESKRLHYGANDPVAKGHDRVDKHAKQMESDLERYAAAGPGMDRQPGEEKLTDAELDRATSQRETKQT